MITTLLLELSIVTAAAAAVATSGTFTALTFNVAGLPQILQGNDVPGDKTTNAGILGTYFADYGYDIINMQEDFNYHAYIYATDNHPYRTATSGGAAIGSGLNTISNYNWLSFARVKWNTCSDASSNDCLTPKGFTFMRWNPSEGVFIDVYNLHADAGTEDGDETARNANLQQVADYIDTWSVGNAVLVMGDTNSRYTRIKDTAIRVFSSQNGLSDAWVQLQHGGVYPTAGAPDDVCSNPSTTNTCETVDKMLFRSSAALSLKATSFTYDGGEFLNTDPKYKGSVLSDHNPELAHFSWSLSSSFRQSNFWGGPHGTWFNDLSKLPKAPVVSRITFRGSERLDAVGIALSDGTTFSHGGAGGVEASLTLAPNEYWTSATLCQGQKDGWTRNFYIMATTSAGKTVKAGTATSDCATFTADKGWSIVGFLGQDGDEIDQLAFIYAPIY